MSKATTIADRPNLGESLAQTIREMIFDGRLAAGSRLNEVHLSQKLGVSRTPLREALSALVSEGALESIPRRGFFVCRLTVDEASAIYPIRSFLDTEALRLSGIPSPAGMRRLANIRAQLARTNNVHEAIRLDDAWHEVLWSNCPNPVLINLIHQFMHRTRRYELASMRNREVITQSSNSKSDIEGHLLANDLSKACERLRKSLEDGLQPVLQWLAHRDKQIGETS